MLRQKSQPTIVVKLRMTHHQNVNPADLATPEKRRQDRLANVEVFAGKATAIDHHDLGAGEFDYRGISLANVQKRNP